VIQHPIHDSPNAVWKKDNVALDDYGGGDSEYPVDYPLYKSFWSLQNLLSSPSAVVQSRQSANDFILTTEKVLDAFEGCKRGEEDREWGRKRWLEEKKEGEVVSSDDKEEVRKSGARRRVVMTDRMAKMDCSYGFMP
jgi:hypothetical protein